MAGSGGGSTTTQKADPWVGMQPALSSLYNNANQLYGQGALAPNQILNTYQPMNGTQWDAMSQMTNGNAYTNSALSNTTKLANGDFSSSPGAARLNEVATNTDAGGLALQQILAGGDQASRVLGAVANGSDAGSQTLLGITNGTNVGAATLAQFANGSLVDPNSPYAKMLFNAQADPITKQFQTATLPGLLSAYSSAGRYGSGSNDTAINAASDSLAQNLGNLSQQTIAQNYYNERQRQFDASGQLATLQGNAAQALSGIQTGAATTLSGIRTGAANSLSQNKLGAASQLTAAQGNAISALDQMGWNRVAQAMNAGTLMQQNMQAQTDSQVAQYNYDSNKGLLGAQNLSQILQGGFSLNGQTQTQSGGGNKAMGALGGAASGALAGSYFGPWGTAIGAGIGGLYGGLS